MLRQLDTIVVGTSFDELKKGTIENLSPRETANNVIKQQSMGSLSDLNLYESTTKKNRKKYFFLHPSSLASTKIQNETYKVMLVYINNQLQSLVQVVLEVLQSINSEKIKILKEAMQSPRTISAILTELKMEPFFHALKTTSLISSPEDFTFMLGLAIDERGDCSKNKFKRQIIAETIEMPPISGFDNLLTETRKHILTFPESKSKERAIGNSLVKIEILSSASIKSAEKEKLRHKENVMLPTKIAPSDNVELSSTKSTENVNLSIKSSENKKCGLIINNKNEGSNRRHSKKYSVLNNPSKTSSNISNQRATVQVIMN